MTTSAGGYEEVLDTFYLMTALFAFSASLAWGVNTLFLLEAGLAVHEVFVVGAVFAAAMALLEIPTGVFADIYGRRLSILLGTLLLAAGTFLYAAAGFLHLGLWGLCCVSVSMASGYAFCSGALEAWAVDALREAGSPHTLDSVFARAAFFSGAAMLLGTAGGGLLASVHMAFPYLLRTACFLGAARLAYKRVADSGFSRREVAFLSLPAEVKKAASASFYFGWKEPRACRLIAAGAFQAFFIAWGYHAWQPYFLGFLEDGGPWTAGLIAAAVALASMAGNAAVARLEPYCGRRTTLLLCAGGVFGVAVIGVGAADAFWPAVGFYLAAMFALGVFAPVQQAYLHRVTPGQYRATAASFSALTGHGASMLGQSVLGGAMRLRSLDFGYVAGGFAALGAVPAVLMLRALGGDGDEFKSKAGLQRPAPAQGHPVVI